MENIMDFTNGLTEAQSICLRADAVDDLKRAIVLVFQFLTRSGCADVFPGQLYLVTHGVLSGPCPVTSVLLLLLGRIAEHIN